MNTSFTRLSKAFVHGFRVHGLRPRPGMTSSQSKLSTTRSRSARVAAIAARNAPSSPEIKRGWYFTTPRHRGTCSGTWRRRRYRYSGRSTKVDRTFQRLAVGPLTRHQHDPGQDFVADPQHETDRAAFVEQPHRRAVGEAAPGGFVRVQDAVRRSLAAAQELDPGIGRVRLEIAGGGQQAQRPARRVAFLLGVEPPVRHRLEPRSGHLLRIEFEPARGRPELLLPRFGVTHGTAGA